MTALLSDPILDELYSIRRIMVSMHVAHSGARPVDPWKLTYYATKVQALDHAIAAYIEVNNVPNEHQEQQAMTAIGMLKAASQEAGVRIPGGI